LGYFFNVIEKVIEILFESILFNSDMSLRQNCHLQVLSHLNVLMSYSLMIQKRK